MTTQTLNKAEKSMLVAMKAAIAEKGSDYRYDQDESTGAPNHCHPTMTSVSCSYLVWRDAPLGTTPTEASCLIGQGALNSGLATAEWLVTCEGFDASDVVSYLRMGDDYCGDDFTEAMCLIQSAQDTGYTWEYAWDQGLHSLTQAGYDVANFYF